MIGSPMVTATSTPSRSPGGFLFYPHPPVARQEPRHRIWISRSGLCGGGTKVFCVDEMLSTGMGLAAGVQPRTDIIRTRGKEKSGELYSWF